MSSNDETGLDGKTVTRNTTEEDPGAMGGKLCSTADGTSSDGEVEDISGKIPGAEEEDPKKPKTFRLTVYCKGQYRLLSSVKKGDVKPDLSNNIHLKVQIGNRIYYNKDLIGRAVDCVCTGINRTKEMDVVKLHIEKEEEELWLKKRLTPSN